MNLINTIVKITFTICFIFAGINGFSQGSNSLKKENNLNKNANFSPIKPVAGDVVHIVYHAGNVNSHISIHDDLYIVMTIFDQDWSVKVEWSKMRKNANDFIYDKKIDLNTALIRASFVTLIPGVYDYLDPTIMIMIHGMDGFSVFNAFNCAMYINNCEQNFELEINRYPYNYTAYRNKWLWLGLANRKNVLDIVKKDMKYLSQIKSNEYNIFNSLSFGYLLMNDEPKGREMLLEMLNMDPGNPLNIMVPVF